MATKTKTVKPSNEDLILGAKEEAKEVQVIDYTSRNIKYKVFIKENQREITVNGREIGTFLGQNLAARRELEEGKKKVRVLSSKGDELYKIEVL